MIEEAESFAQVVDALRAGRAAIFPTDTVIGLGVSVAHCSSPDILFELKRRPMGKPVSWLVGDPDALCVYGCDVPRAAFEAVDEGWPGALTVVVKASERVPEAFRSEMGTIGLRMPASESALALIRALGSPLATTSANMSGEAPLRRVCDAPCELTNHTVVLDSGEEGLGTASTVIDFTKRPPVVIRG